jgi:dTDP-4-dehydrorhamnose reductase
VRSLVAVADREFEVVARGRPELDITDRTSVSRAIASDKPDIVVNAAAYTAVDKAESEEAAAFAINADGAGNVAAAAREAGVPVIHLSTDYVFSGDAQRPYVEADPTGPVSAYGRSKLRGEEAVAAANPAHAILRTAWVYSPYGQNFVKTMRRLAQDRDVVRVVADQRGSPTYALDAARGILSVARVALAEPEGSRWRGVFHMTGGGETDWAGFAEAIFAELAANGEKSAKVERITTAEYPTPARRPMNSCLDNTRFTRTFAHALPDWRDGLRRCVGELLQG